MVLLSWEPAAPPPCRLYRAPGTPPLTLHTNIHISDSLNKVCTYLLRSSGLSWNLEISNQIETLFLETKKYLISSVYYHELECLWTVSRHWCWCCQHHCVLLTVPMFSQPPLKTIISQPHHILSLSSELRARPIKLNFSCIWRTWLGWYWLAAIESDSMTRWSKVGRSRLCKESLAERECLT